MSRASTLVLGTLCLLAVPAAADKPEIQWDPDYDFSTVRTFAWDSSQVTLENADPILHRQIVNAIQEELSDRGLVQVESNPDVRVTYHASAQREVVLQPSATSYGIGGYGLPDWNHYGYGRAGPIYLDTQVVEIGEGTLIVDIWDNAANVLIWRGVASEINVSGNMDKTGRNAEKAIRQMAKHAAKLREEAGD